MNNSICNHQLKHTPSTVGLVHNRNHCLDDMDVTVVSWFYQIWQQHYYHPGSHLRHHVGSTVVSLRKFKILWVTCIINEWETHCSEVAVYYIKHPTIGFTHSLLTFILRQSSLRRVLSLISSESKWSRRKSSPMSRRCFANRILRRAWIQKSKKLNIHCVRENRNRQYFGHNFDKFKHIVVFFARNSKKVMRNY